MKPNMTHFLLFLVMLLFMLYILAGCGATLTNREEGVSEKRYAIYYPNCDRPEWSYEQVTGCIEKCTTFTFNGEVFDIPSLIEKAKGGE